MTDTSILPGAALPAPETAPAPPAEFDEGDTADDRRRLLIIGGVVLAVVVVLVAFLLLRGGGSSTSSNATSGLVPRGTPAAAAPGAGGSTPAKSATSRKSGGSAAGTVLPKKSTTSLARDPFKPLVVVPVAGAPSGSTSVKPAAGSAPGATGSSPSQGGGAPASFGTPQSIRLVRVHGTKDAVFDVTYSHHKVFRYDVIAPSASSASGTVFGNDFALLGIQSGDATVQVGDATPFDLAVGSSHTV